MEYEQLIGVFKPLSSWIFRFYIYPQFLTNQLDFRYNHVFTSRVETVWIGVLTVFKTGYIHYPTLS